MGGGGAVGTAGVRHLGSCPQGASGFGVAASTSWCRQMTKRGAGSAGANWRRRMWAEGLAPRSLKSTPGEAPPSTTTTPQGVAAAARPGGARPEKRKLPRSPQPPAAPQPSLFPASNPGQDGNKSGGAVSPGGSSSGPPASSSLAQRVHRRHGAEIAALPGRGHRLPSPLPSFPQRSPGPSSNLAPATPPGACQLSQALLRGCQQQGVACKQAGSERKQPGQTGTAAALFNPSGNLEIRLD